MKNEMFAPLKFTTNFLKKTASAEAASGDFVLLFQQDNLEGMYAGGQGGPQDYQQAVVWTRQAAELGHAHAQYQLGLMYSTGLGVPQDDQQAVIWYRNAAEQGVAMAQAMLGVLYDQGLGVMQNDQHALAWTRRAAEQGVTTAQLMLGGMYAIGQGVPKDFKLAYAWCSVAAANGDDGKAAELRDLVAEELTPSALSEVQALASRYFELFQPKS